MGLLTAASSACLTHGLCIHDIQIQDTGPCTGEEALVMSVQCVPGSRSSQGTLHPRTDFTPNRAAYRSERMRSCSRNTAPLPGKARRAGTRRDYL